MRHERESISINMSIRYHVGELKVVSGVDNSADGWGQSGGEAGGAS